MSLRRQLSSWSRLKIQHQEPLFIGVAGGTASGKTTVCDQVINRLQEQSVAVICLDSFYRDLTPEEIEAAENGLHNFDSPNAFDTETMMDCLEHLKVIRKAELFVYKLAQPRQWNPRLELYSNALWFFFNLVQVLQPYDIPEYDFTTHKRSGKTRRVMPADVIIVEGILVLHIEEIRSMLNMKIYVDTDDDVRLARRIQRDVKHRGRDVAGVIEQYTRHVKPAFDQFIAPSRRHADVIIPWHR